MGSIGESCWKGRARFWIYPKGFSRIENPGNNFEIEQGRITELWWIYRGMFLRYPKGFRGIEYPSNHFEIE